ncbi:hypothetical protein F4778DRAFT_213011 [Xylariomycetidae sp. FL2044]|nr:hypothetical protein F4778DRAFT_213011 [Xylariomycetidae sp. FL2044]
MESSDLPTWQTSLAYNAWLKERNKQYGCMKQHVLIYILNEDSRINSKTEMTFQVMQHLYDTAWEPTVKECLNILRAKDIATAGEIGGTTDRIKADWAATNKSADEVLRKDRIILKAVSIRLRVASQYPRWKKDLTMASARWLMKRQSEEHERSRNTIIGKDTETKSFVVSIEQMLNDMVSALPPSMRPRTTSTAPQTGKPNDTETLEPEPMPGQWYPRATGDKLAINDAFLMEYQRFSQFVAASPGPYPARLRYSALTGHLDRVLKVLPGLNLDESQLDRLKPGDLADPDITATFARFGDIDTMAAVRNRGDAEGHGFNFYKNILGGKLSTQEEADEGAAMRLRGGGPSESGGAPKDEQTQRFEDAKSRVPNVIWTRSTHDWNKIRTDKDLPQHPIEVLNPGREPLMCPGEDMSGALRSGIAKKLDEAYRGANTRRQAVKNEQDAEALRTALSDTRFQIGRQEAVILDFLEQTIDSSVPRDATNLTALPKRYTRATRALWLTMIRVAFALRLFHGIQMTILNRLVPHGSVTILDLLKAEEAKLRAWTMHETLWLEYDFYRWNGLSSLSSQRLVNLRTMARTNILQKWKQAADDIRSRIKTLEGDPKAFDTPPAIRTISRVVSFLDPTTGSFVPDPSVKTGKAADGTGGPAPSSPGSDGKGSAKDDEDPGVDKSKKPSPKRPTTSGKPPIDPPDPGPRKTTAPGGSGKPPIVPPDPDPNTSGPGKSPDDPPDPGPRKTTTSSSDDLREKQLEYWQDLRSKYEVEVQKFIDSNHALDASDPGDHTEISMNNYNINLKNGMIWQATKEIDALHNALYPSGPGAGAKLTVTRMPLEHYQNTNTKLFPVLKELPSGVTSCVSSFPGHASKLTLPNVLVGGAGSFGQKPLDGSSWATYNVLKGAAPAALGGTTGAPGTSTGAMAKRATALPTAAESFDETWDSYVTLLGILGYPTPEKPPPEYEAQYPYILKQIGDQTNALALKFGLDPAALKSMTQDEIIVAWANAAEKYRTPPTPATPTDLKTSAVRPPATPTDVKLSVVTPPPSLCTKTWTFQAIQDDAQYDSFAAVAGKSDDDAEGLFRAWAATYLWYIKQRIEQGMNARGAALHPESEWERLLNSIMKRVSSFNLAPNPTPFIHDRRHHARIRKYVTESMPGAIEKRFKVTLDGAASASAPVSAPVPAPGSRKRSSVNALINGEDEGEMDRRRKRKRMEQARLKAEQEKRDQEARETEERKAREMQKAFRREAAEKAAADDPARHRQEEEEEAARKQAEADAAAKAWKAKAEAEAAAAAKAEEAKRKAAAAAESAAASAAEVEKRKAAAAAAEAARIRADPSAKVVARCQKTGAVVDGWPLLKQMLEAVHRGYLNLQREEEGKGKGLGLKKDGGKTTTTTSYWGPQRQDQDPLPKIPEMPKPRPMGDGSGAYVL